jgi:hypothetical protein
MVRARALRRLLGCSAAMSILLSGLTAQSAGADDSSAGPALNGRFLATSNGDWAQTNDIYHDEQTVRQVWTITSSCVDPLTCSGTVTSSQGWSADLRFDSAAWSFDRVVGNWQPCPDGSTVAGTQKDRFWAVGPDGLRIDKNVTLLAGFETTSGKSGDCGINRPLVINVPLRVQKLE